MGRLQTHVPTALTDSLHPDPTDPMQTSGSRSSEREPHAFQTERRAAVAIPRCPAAPPPPASASIAPQPPS